jgi:flagellar hook-associated protein 1 FlgK
MDFQIGLSGLRVAQQAIDLVGTNLANVSTEGYHRQEVLVEPRATNPLMGIPIGGAEISRYRRTVDTLLESEILSQQPRHGQVAQELMTLEALQGSFGTLDSEGLSTVLNRFFGAVRELATDPVGQALREQAVWAADAVARDFRHLGGVLDDLDTQIVVEARNTADHINVLTEQIADLNGEIQTILMRGGNANLTIDRRDQAISELAGLIDVSVQHAGDGNGLVNVHIPGAPVVIGTRSVVVEAIPQPDRQLALRVANNSVYDTEIRGGKLGGLFALRNELLAGVRSDLDGLATTLIREVNRLHVQGVGSAGSFDGLSGTRVSDPTGAIEEWGSDVTAGTMHLRLIAPDGSVTRHTVTIDPTTDTLETVAAAFDALDPAHLSASVVDAQLHLDGRLGYRFDFLPTPSLALGAPWTGTSTPEASGVYTGPANDTLTFTVQGGGDVGVDVGLALEVRNGAGAVVTTLAVGAGYAAGDRIDVYEGLSLAFDPGTLVAGEQFSVEVLANSDPTGFLAAAGMNTLFSGTRAADMALRQDILDDPRRLATALGAEQSDNHVTRAIAAMGEARFADLGDASATDAFRMIVTGVGQQIGIRQARRDALVNVLHELENQRDAISGVDINEEAANLLLFEKMFEAMAKVLSTQQNAMQTLMDIV